VLVLSLIHQESAASGVFGEAVVEGGHQLEEHSLAFGTGPPRAPEEYDAVMVFGGSMHADQEDAHPWLREEKAMLRRLLDQGVPTLGVCLGAQLLADAAGAEVRRAPEAEIGWHPVELTPEATDDPVFGALPASFDALEWHRYEFELPPGAVALATNAACLQAYRVGERAWGIQFHAEVTADALRKWIATYDEDEDAVRLGFDPVRMTEESRERVGDWNALGRELCTRFLEVAERTRVNP
jgi:GMP synthase-like glutamine amidotransferase